MSQPLLTESPEKAKQRIARREPQLDPAQSFQGGGNSLLQLQRTLGNQRVAQLIQAKRITPEGKIIGLQPKLTVGAADDQYEQEADRAARKVVAMPDPIAMAPLQQAHQGEGEAGQAQRRTLQSKPSPLAASITPFVQRQMDGEEKIEEEKDQEEDKYELLQAKLLNKSTALPLQQQPVIEEREPELVKAKRLIQREALAEEDKDKIQTKPLAAAVTSLMQRRAENNKQPKDEEIPVQAKSLIQKIVSQEEKNREIQTKPLTLPATSLVQRQAENDEDAENNDPTIRAKLVNETYGNPLQRRSSIEEEEAESIQTKSPVSLSGSFEVGDDIESRLSQSKGSDSPLPNAARSYVEPRFGADFGHVRVHTGSDSMQMNQAIGAQAFTHGADVYYGTGSSPANLELTAYELTHVVQQTGKSASIAQSIKPNHSEHANRNRQVWMTRTHFVQRDAQGTQTAAVGQTPGAVVTPPPSAGQRSILHEQRQISEDWKETEALLKQMIAREGWEATDAWSYRFINAEPIRDSAYANGDIALVGRIRDRLRTEIKIMENAVTQLVRDVKSDTGDVVIGGGDFPKAAQKNTELLLNNSEKQVKAEAARYGLKIEGIFFKDYSMTAGGPLQTGLQEAARILAAKRRETNKALNSFLNAQKTSTGKNPFLPDLEGTIATTRKQWVELEDAYHALCQEKQKNYPILAAYTTLDDAVARLDELGSQSTNKLAENLYKTVDDRLKNIETVRSEIGVRYSIWKQPQIIALTKKTLNVEPWQSRVIDDKARKVKGDEAADAKFFAAIALGLGLLAAIPTGGTSLLAGVAVAGASVGAAYSMYALYQHYKDYELASAATGTGFAESISKDQPDLLWLAHDLLDLGMNVVGASAAFKTLSTAITAAQTSKLAKLPELVEITQKIGLSPVAQSRVIAVASRGLTSGSTAGRMLKAVGASFRKADLAEVARRLEQIADKGFHGVYINLQANGRIRPLTEKALVEVFGREVANMRIAAGQLEKTGFFHPTAGGYLFIKPGSLDSVTSTVVHEATHWLQNSQTGKNLENFMAEFEAYSMERRYARSVIQDAASQGKDALKAVPSEVISAANFSDEKIAQLIREEYGYSVPSSIDGEKAVRTVLARLKGFE